MRRLFHLLSFILIIIYCKKEDLLPEFVARRLGCWKRDNAIYVYPGESIDVVAEEIKGVGLAYKIGSETKVKQLQIAISGGEDIIVNDSAFTHPQYPCGQANYGINKINNTQLNLGTQKDWQEQLWGWGTSLIWYSNGAWDKMRNNKWIYRSKPKVAPNGFFAGSIMLLTYPFTPEELDSSEDSDAQALTKLLNEKGGHEPGKEGGIFPMFDTYSQKYPFYNGPYELMKFMTQNEKIQKMCQNNPSAIHFILPTNVFIDDGSYKADSISAMEIDILRMLWPRLSIEKKRKIVFWIKYKGEYYIVKNPSFENVKETSTRWTLDEKKLVDKIISANLLKKVEISESYDVTSVQRMSVK